MILEKIGSSISNILYSLLELKEENSSNDSPAENLGPSLLYILNGLKDLYVLRGHRSALHPD